MLSWDITHISNFRYLPEKEETTTKKRVRESEAKKKIIFIFICLVLKIARILKNKFVTYFKTEYWPHHIICSIVILS